MGQISTILYENVDGYTKEDCAKDYWFQNMLDKNSFDEFEEYKIQQRRVRDEIIRKNKSNDIHIKADTAILSTSLKGVVLIAECEKI